MILRTSAIPRKTAPSLQEDQCYPLIFSAADLIRPATALSAEFANVEVASLNAVTKKYAAHLALDAVNLTIGRGELVALLGPNGAGKTTAVKLMLGLLNPDSGNVRVFGRDPREPRNRQRTGAMLQIGRVPETLRVREHIDLFSSYYSHPLPMAEIIGTAGLKGVENRLFGELSGGQKQRLLFALAICGDPDLLFLDEPTVGLDVQARRALWKQIRGLLARGKSILLTTHYLEEADALANRIVVIDNGRIIADGTPHQVKQDASLEDAFLALTGVEGELQ